MYSIDLFDEVLNMRFNDSDDDDELADVIPIPVDVTPLAPHLPEVTTTNVEDRLGVLLRYSGSCSEYDLLIARQRDARRVLLQAQWRDDFEQRYPPPPPQSSTRSTTSMMPGTHQSRNPRLNPRLNPSERRIIDDLYAVSDKYPTDEQFAQLHKDLQFKYTIKNLRQRFATLRYQDTRR